MQWGAAEGRQAIVNWTPQWIAWLVAAAVTIGYGWPSLRWRAVPLEHRLRDALRRPLLGWWLAAFLSVLVNWQAAMRWGVPEPQIQDEFSYVLAADTFAHGRLTNPTHPLWRFFETFHELQRPSYMSKYPPGHGLMLAAGQVLGNDPLLGAWLEASLLCVSAGWMLFGFLPAATSVLGAMTVAVTPVVLQWSQSFWGGSLAAIGGCLVVGAWARLLRDRRWPAGVCLGVGLSILVLTRPYEGLLFSVPFVGWCLIRPRLELSATVAVLLCCGAWLMYDNHRVTGHPLLLPYTAYERQYALAPPFLWQHPRPDHFYDRPVMQEMAEQQELRHFWTQHSLRGYWGVLTNEKLPYLCREIGSPWLLWAAVLCVPAALASDHRLRWPLAAMTLVLLGTFLSNWTRTQYVAPALPVLVLVGLAALHHASRRFPALTRGIGTGILAGMIVVVVSPPAIRSNHQRSTIEHMLLALGGRHLVIVTYLPGHRVDDEWVYNAADIDASPVVWAADRGPAEDRALLQYFAGRTVWSCEVDGLAARYHRLAPTP